MYNLTSEISDFQYYGVDVVESIIDASKLRYKNMSENWKIEVLDFTQQKLPDNYEMIFTRDSLMHLSYEKIFDALKAFARVKGARFLLAGSYLKNNVNKNIKIGNWFKINLLKPPFNLNKYIEIFEENDGKDKSLILYDIPNYLSKIDFDQIKASTLKLNH